jgi:phospholipid N-methyltransferase
LKIEKKVAFLKQSLRKFSEMGTVVRSGDQMCSKMTRFIPRHEDITIVELGAGDGAITDFIVKRMTKGSRLITFEINPDFLGHLKEIADHRVTIVNDSAEHLSKILRELGIDKVDMIISAIPFLVLSDELTKEILKEAKSNLKVGGTFVQMHYALSMRRTYEELFGNLETFFVPINIPPGYVFKCEKN